MQQQGKSGPLTRRLWRLSVLVAACALLLSFSGPLLDHHFAERQHDHVHIYLGPAAPDHAHPYEVSHVHSHVHDASDVATGSSPSGHPAPGDIVFLTSHDAVGQDFAPVTAPVIQGAAVFPDLGDGGSVFSLAHSNAVPPEAFVPPPKKPPRV